MFNFENIKETNVMKPAPRKTGCTLTEIKRNEDQSVSFVFVDGTGGTLTDRSFIPSKLDQMSDEEFKKSVQLNVARIAHICRAFVTEEQFLAIKVEDPNNLSKVKENWLSITRQVGGLLGPKIKEKADMSCDLKVIYKKNNKDGKYYSALPMVPPFISTKNHPKEFTTNPQYDIYEIPAIRPDAEKAPSQAVGGGDFTTTGNIGNATIENSGSEF